MGLFYESGIEPPTRPPVMAATKWQDNSAMTLDLAQLGYIPADGLVLDPTYQDGTWWKRWPEGTPRRLVTNSLDPANSADLCFDFRCAPFPDNTFDAVCYDPPYVSKGGRSTSTIQDHQRRYGLVDAPKSPLELQRLINAGSSEMFRVLKPRGYLMVKCQDYVSSGKVWWGTDQTRNWLEYGHGAVCVDRLYFLNNGSAQPPRTRADGKPSVQQHARVNVSTLWVFKKKGQESK